MKRKITPMSCVLFAIFLIYSLTILFVIFWGINISLMSTKDYNGNLMFPTAIQFVNYAKAWTSLSDGDSSLAFMTLNSFLYAGGTSFLCIIFSTMTSYVVSKFRFPGRSFIYGYAIVTMMIPILGATAAEIKFQLTLGIYDTYFLFIIMASSFGQNFIIFLAAFDSVSWEYAESAKIDGANNLTIFLRIMMPQILSPMVAMFMVEFIMRWGDTDMALLYMKTHPNLGSGMYIYGKRNSYNVPVYFAGFTMCMIPSLALFLCFQKSIMDIQLGGGLKG